MLTQDLTHPRGVVPEVDRVLLLRTVHRQLGPAQPARELPRVPGDTLMRHYDAELVEPRLCPLEHTNVKVVVGRHRAVEELLPADEAHLAWLRQPHDAVGGEVLGVGHLPPCKVEVGHHAVQGVAQQRRVLEATRADLPVEPPLERLVAHVGRAPYAGLAGGGVSELEVHNVLLGVVAVLAHPITPQPLPVVVGEVAHDRASRLVHVHEDNREARRRPVRAFDELAHRRQRVGRWLEGRAGGGGRGASCMACPGDDRLARDVAVGRAAPR
eukprot:scaffold91363_cov56-Phaeocystis_antarctica.AAC.3